MKIELKTEIQYLKGVGPKAAEKLERLGIKTVRDLLFYWPWRYDDFSAPQPIGNLRVGIDAVIRAEIKEIHQSRTRRQWLSITEAKLEDKSGAIKAIWFNQPFLIKVLKPGDEWLFAGKINYDFSNKVKMLAVSQYEREPIILPVYKETAGITSKYLRKLISNIFGELEDPIDDFLPTAIKKEYQLIDLDQAIRQIHFPENNEQIYEAKKRLSFDELFLISLRMFLAKNELSKSQTIVLTFDKKILQDFVSRLPFQLTNAQRKAAWEIIQDLSRPRPMNRLLEGDVGSGKTVVAAMAVLVAAKNKYQSVWLAPTEILANQHFQNVAKILKPFKIKVGLMTAANKSTNLQKDDLIIGTHALLQKNIEIPKLALVIVDEQHRFGVAQRSHLRNSEFRIQKSELIKVPHFLSMTATPIPRTLALSLYGDLDLSIINEMPLGRQRVETRVVAPENRAKAYDFIRAQIKAGRQAFVICPLIEPKDQLKINLFDTDRKSALQEYEKLSKNIFPDLKIGLLHGRLKSKEKDETMTKFAKGEYQLLVSTAVIEVGIDIPNATVMMIESAERFGLAQLHQFRGRVGRGKFKSYCFLFTESISPKTKERLQAMQNCYDGFKLAEIDLKMRGPGELAGVRQSGLPDLKMASLSDIILIEKAKKAAEEIFPTIAQFPMLQAKLHEFEDGRHLE